jgi:hypothetical protein
MSRRSLETLVVFVCSLVLVNCFPELAYSQPFETGTASGDGQENQKGLMTSDTPLPVGPGPGGGGRPINPDNYGMCGLLGLSGHFDAQTIVRIKIGANGLYEVHRQWLGTSNATQPVVDWTCIHLKDFTGPLPVPGKFATKEPPPVMTHGGPRNEVQLSSGSRMFGTACIWAGVAGGLSTRVTDQDNASFASYDESGGTYPGVTWEGAQSTKGVTIFTFVFCSEFPGTDFIWDFYKTTIDFPHGDGQAFHQFLPVRPKDQWCYMQGVAATGTSENPQSAFQAALGIDKTPPPPWDAGGPIYYEDIDSNGNAALYWNCMPIAQKGF